MKTISNNIQCRLQKYPVEAYLYALPFGTSNKCHGEEFKGNSRKVCMTIRTLYLLKSSNRKSQDKKDDHVWRKCQGHSRCQHSPLRDQTDSFSSILVGQIREQSSSKSLSSDQYRLRHLSQVTILTDQVPLKRQIATYTLRGE